MEVDNFYHLEYLDYCLHLHCYTQCFGRYVLRFSSSVSRRTREPTQNLELNHLFNTSLSKSRA